MDYALYKPEVSNASAGDQSIYQEKKAKYESTIEILVIGRMRMRRDDPCGMH
jgi:hypothetical protein